MNSNIRKKGFAPVELGPGSKIDRGVLLGYIAGRKITTGPLIIGEKVRLRSGTVIYSNVTVGERLETGHNVVIREESRFGDNVSIRNNTVIDYGCIVGSNVKIHCNVYLAQFTEIEDDVFIAPGVTVANDLHPVCTLCMKSPRFSIMAVEEKNKNIGQPIISKAATTPICEPFSRSSFLPIQ